MKEHIDLPMALKKAFLMFLMISVVLVIAISGCSDEKTSSAAADQKTSQTAQQTSPQTTEQASSDPAAEYRQLEITPSGDSKCFLSPCDCVCYPIPNVPKTAKKPTCAVDCNAEYGKTGCRFTNYQCVTLP